MSCIYQPKGRAAEYADLALNYYHRCDHGCSYCAIADLLKGFNIPGEVGLLKKFSMGNVRRELSMGPVNDPVLLCFAGDPYCRAEMTMRITRDVLELFLEQKVPVTILTKGGSRCLRDLGLFRRFDRENIPISVGATLTFLDEHDSRTWEPGAALPADRLYALEQLHENGIPTWASFEPVIDPIQSLSLITHSLEYVDEFKIGVLNHHPEVEQQLGLASKYKDFGKAAIEILEAAGKKYMIKQDLKRFMGVRR